MSKILKKAFEYIFIFVLLVFAVTLMYTAWGFIWSFPLMWAWNYTMPYLFGLPQAGYWHMFCLYMILSSLWKITAVTGNSK